MKFKKGDTVRIISQESTFHSFGIVRQMERILGTIQVVDDDEEYGDEGGYEINGYTWHEDDLELASAPAKEKSYVRQHILDLIERIAQEFDVEWNGDSDTVEESFILNGCAETIRSYKADYE